MSRGLTDTEIANSREKQIMNLIAKRAGYYRKNPHRFVKDYLGVDLKLFQKIIIYAMMVYDMFYFIACRSIGKTFLVSLYGVCRCILYPGQRIVCVSATFKQGKEIIEKCTDIFMPKSALLRSEIEKYSTGQNDCFIRFKNGSIMKVVTATESSRGGRSHILIVDESRLIPQKIVDDILRPMNGTPRQPGYLRKPEYANMLEIPKEFYLSSAYYAASEMYENVKAYTANSLDDSLNYICIDLPYQLSIKEGILLPQTIRNKMSEATFSDISFMMEYEGKFYGSIEDALFDFKILEQRRILTEPFFDLDYYRYSKTSPPKKENDEIRLLTVDIALMASKKHNNDASALIIDRLIPTANHEYINNMAYIDTKEGIVTEELGLIVMRYFYQYDCDYMVIDGNGIGQAIVDYCLQDRYDPLYGVTYGAINAVNDDVISSRCKTKNARKAMFVIKATAKFNNDMILSLRAGFQNGNINLLVNESEIDMILPKIVKGYNKLPDLQRDKLKLPFIQTSLLINELINLGHDVSNGLIKVKEKSGMRKDRFSACGYGYAISQELSRELKPKNTNVESLINKLVIHRGSFNGMTI